MRDKEKRINSEGWRVLDRRKVVFEKRKLEIVCTHSLQDAIGKERNMIRIFSVWFVDRPIELLDPQYLGP